jgi:hypothetical protein
MTAPTLWLNIEWADGTETNFDSSAKYRKLGEAKEWAVKRCSITGCPVNVMQGGAVRARFEVSGDPNERGYCPVRITHESEDRRGQKIA